MRNFLFFFMLCISTILQAQALFTERFNSFKMDTTQAAGAWYFSNDAGNVDSISLVNSMHLNRVGFTYLDQDDEDSPFNIAHTVTDIQSGDLFWGDAADGGIDDILRPDGEDYTLVVVARYSNFSGILLARNAGNAYWFRASNSSNNGIGYYVRGHDGTLFYDQYMNSSPEGFKSGDWNIWVVSADRDGDFNVYCNGVKQSSLTIGMWNSVGDISPSTSIDFTVGALNAGGTQGFVGDLAYAAFHKSFAFSEKRAKEFGFLADGWKSRNGNVTRADSSDTWKFHQGFYQDTISTVINLTGDINIKFQAYSPGGGSVNAWTSGNSLVSKTLTGTNSNFSINMGAGDSLFFARSANDTVYVDNIVISVSLGDSERS
jgi:hypothetical protein